MSVSGEGCDFSDRSLCDGPITRPEESYRLCVCVCVCVFVYVTECGDAQNNPLHIQCVGRKSETRKVHFYLHIICQFVFFF